ncbi:MAG: hypothetical protein A2583_11735 [Bdellovibrionales bacterium RIFOXYD1_FULL_53_11]|nr:MAG: hypothetical protein A2583_11735 [Bdellovibrionales bacterium RIFOXYD1_FULL_53_11]
MNKTGFVKNKRVLVTGGSGFIASHMVRRLLEEGAEVFITTKYNSIIDNVRLAALWDRIGVIEADLRNPDSLAQIKAVKPEIILHFGAYNHVGDSFTHVLESLNSNAVGTACLMEAYKEYERFVYIATSEVYGFQKSVPFVETMTPFPTSPYAVGKFGGELYARMQHHVYGLPVSVIRPFNAYGPYQSPRAIIAELIIKGLRGQLIQTTEGKQTRDFNYVTNLVDGILLAAASKECVGQVTNIGSGEEIAVRDLVLKIHELTGKKSKLEIGSLPNRPTEIWRMQAGNERAKKLLGWEPRVGFEEGLGRTVDWFRRYLDVFANDKSPLLSL